MQYQRGRVLSELLHIFGHCLVHDIFHGEWSGWRIAFAIESGRFQGQGTSNVIVTSGFISEIALLTFFQAVSLALTSATLSLFGQFPSPLLYGHLFDKSCSEFRTDGAAIDSTSADCLHYDVDLLKVREPVCLHFIQRETVPYFKQSD